MKADIIHLFGAPRDVMSEYEMCFASLALQKFMDMDKAKWNTVIAYAPT